MLTFRKLKAFLDSCSESQLDKTATIYDPSIDEFIPVHSVYSLEESDVIDCEDVSHPVLEIGSLG